MADTKYDRCRGCNQRPTTLDKSLGYCEPCGVKRDEFAKAALTGMCANPDISLASAKRGLQPEEVRDSFVESAFKLADKAMTRRGVP